MLSEVTPSPENHTRTHNPKQEANEQEKQNRERQQANPLPESLGKNFLPRGMINYIFAYQLLQGKTVAQENKRLRSVPPVEPGGSQVRAQLMYNLYLHVKNPLI